MRWLAPGDYSAEQQKQLLPVLAQVAQENEDTEALLAHLSQRLSQRKAVEKQMAMRVAHALFEPTASSSGQAGAGVHHTLRPAWPCLNSAPDENLIAGIALGGPYIQRNGRDYLGQTASDQQVIELRNRYKDHYGKKRGIKFTAMKLCGADITAEQLYNSVQAHGGWLQVIRA